MLVLSFKVQRWLRATPRNWRFIQTRAPGIESLSLPYSWVRLESFVPTRFVRFNRKAEEGEREWSYSRHDFAIGDVSQGRFDVIGWRKSAESDPQRCLAPHRNPDLRARRLA
jgi:hypothetical protein